MPLRAKDLGDADLTIGHLSLWVHGRQFSDAQDFWDGNWLSVTAIYQRERSTIAAGGPILHTPELAALADQTDRLCSTLQGRAVLDTMEPNLKVSLEGDGRGHVAVTVAITPDHLAESHEFREEIDQTYLPTILAQCRTLLGRYPVRGSANR